jgi:FlaG/FlaF family flagellin (archaellin)
MHPPLHGIAKGLLLLCGLVGLSACGTSGGTPSSGGQATATTSASAASSASAVLSCTIHEEPLTADTVSVTLSCTVTGAAASETSFTVSHTSAGPKGQGQAVNATCSGPLRGGVGTCSVTFIESATGAAPGSVAGELFPSHRPLGPVTPAFAP